MYQNRRFIGRRNHPKMISTKTQPNKNNNTVVFSTSIFLSLVDVFLSFYFRAPHSPVEPISRNTFFFVFVFDYIPPSLWHSIDALWIIYRRERERKYRLLNLPLSPVALSSNSSHSIVPPEKVSKFGKSLVITIKNKKKTNSNAIQQHSMELLLNCEWVLPDFEIFVYGNSLWYFL